MGKLDMSSSMPVVNPSIVLREEFDDWAILFDPETGDAYAMNPVSVFIWKHLDGNHTIREIHDGLRDVCEGMPDTAEHDIEEFTRELIEKGYAGFRHGV